VNNPKFPINETENKDRAWGADPQRTFPSETKKKPPTTAGGKSIPRRRSSRGNVISGVERKRTETEGKWGGTPNGPKGEVLRRGETNHIKETLPSKGEMKQSFP